MRSSVDDPSQFSVAGFLSNEPNMGVTTIATNVAIRAADHHFGKVLLVDADMRSRGVSRLFRLRKSPGLSDFLDGAVELESTIHESPIDGLFVLPAGVSKTRQTMTMQPAHAADIIGDLRAKFDFLVFDLGPAFEMNSSSLLAREMDSNVLVLRSGTCRRDDAIRQTKMLHDDKIPIAGAVLTRHHIYTPGWMSRWF
ncbi:MAG: CpsD/CapB family tyrosine-protein kinase [Pirellula sp.]